MKRPPIVAILGHVDHGKTTLLDKLRKSRLTDREAGGITQSIGAYQLKYQKPGISTTGRSPSGGKHQTLITFIDTPGHESFAKMRSRGAQVADIALLVIAADDGVKPQTLEALAHIKAARTPFIVTINKIDHPEAKAEAVKTQLAEHEAAVEGYGGTNPVVEISAKEGKNLDELLEMISLVYDLQEIEIDANAPLEAPVIESQLDAKIGPLASVILKQGTLAVGDHVFAAGTESRVKALINEDGQRINKAVPGQPVAILGLKTVPEVGTVITDQSTSDSTSEESKPTSQEESRDSSPGVGPDSPGVESPTFNIILKADATGTLQAIQDSLSHPYTIVSAGVGNITESDILLAAGANAIVVGFRTKAGSSTQKLAQREHIQIITENIIYKLLERLEETTAQNDPAKKLATGRAEIIKMFHIDDQDIAGCLVKTGKLATGDRVTIQKNDKPIAKATIKQLKFRSRIISQAKANQECGVLLEPSEGKKLKLAEGQVIIAVQLSNKNSTAPADQVRHKP